MAESTPGGAPRDRRSDTGPDATAPVVELELDRHVLGSSADAWDTAWGTYGWTPALAGSRAGRLEEVVPWGTRSSRLEHPPFLGGSVRDVLAPDNHFRLNRSWLPMDGRRGFSVWGARERGRDGNDWRVVTHTVLMDDAAFRQLAGHPGGLMAPDGRPAPWFRALVEEQTFRDPVEVDPLRVRVTPDLRAALVRARTEELRDLVRRVLAGRGGDRAGASRELAAVYEALAQAVGSGEVERVVIRMGRDDGAERALLLLAWLSLPLEDRLRVSFVTEQRRAEHPPGHLLGLPGDEWGRYVPAGAWVAGESDLAGVSPGRRLWAERLLADDDLASFRGLASRAAVRGWVLVHRDDLRSVAEHARWVAGWRQRGPSVDAVAELLARERRREAGGRLRAVGDALGRALVEGSPAATGPALRSGRLEEVPRSDVAGRAADPGVDGALERAAHLVGSAPPPARRPLLDGAVRRLRGSDRAADGARLRLRVTEAAESEPGLVADLRRLVDREADGLRGLLGETDGAGTLVRGTFAAAARGDRVAGELLRIGGGEGRWDTSGGAALAARLPVDVEGGDRAVAELLLAAVRDGRDAGALEALAVPLLERAGRGAAALLAADLELLAVEGGAASDRIEAVRRPALDVVSGAGRELDGPARTLILLGRRTAPPAARPEPWLDLVDAAPAAWLGRGPILDALARALDAGAMPFGDVDVPTPARRLATRAVGRVLARIGPEGLDTLQAEALLRLLWLEGSGESLDRLAARRPEVVVPLLARLLVVPAPLPLALRIRSRLRRALDEGAPARNMEDVAPALASRAPALHRRIAPDSPDSPDSAGDRVLLPVRR